MRQIVEEGWLVGPNLEEKRGSAAVAAEARCRLVFGRPRPPRAPFNPVRCVSGCPFGRLRKMSRCRFNPFTRLAFTVPLRTGLSGFFYIPGTSNRPRRLHVNVNVNADGPESSRSRLRSR